MQPLYQISNDLPLQQAPFFGEAYYLLLLNRRQGLLKDESNCRQLKEAIDYRGINRYLHGGQHADEKAMKAPTHSSLNLKIIYPKEVPMAPYVANLVGKSVGTSDINSVFLEEDGLQNMWEEADVLLSQFFWRSLQPVIPILSFSGEKQRFRLCQSRSGCAALSIGRNNGRERKGG